MSERERERGQLRFYLNKSEVFPIPGAPMMITFVDFEDIIIELA